MKDDLFEIGADNIDAESIVARVRQAVEEKKSRGFYTDSRVARAERSNLSNLKDDSEFLSFYLKCLREAVFVDISDFEIVERRRKATGLFVALKRGIWKLLKFYTYRLWSQQNQVNGLMLTAVENMENTYRQKIQSLEEKIADLEAQLNEKS